MIESQDRTDSLQREDGVVQSNTLGLLLDHRSDNESTGEERRCPCRRDGVSS